MNSHKRAGFVAPPARQPHVAPTLTVARLRFDVDNRLKER